MIIRGGTRSNGRQLAYYLLAKGENNFTEILDADGREDMSKSEFSNLLYDMAVTVELTKGKKGLYHAQINPAHLNGEDRKMTRDQWIQAADILGKELGLENQRRVIVLHEKKGCSRPDLDRLHIHIVWERYNHKTGKLVSDSHSRLAQDRVRMELEKLFNHQKTPKRNKHHPELKATLTELWQNTKTAKEFMRKVDKAGYMLAEGTLRHPFMVVDENGRTYDLVRQLKGIRIKEVRDRMRGEKLIHEKKAIELMRRRGEQDKGDKGKEKQKTEYTPQTVRKDNQDDITKDRRAAEEVAREFADSRKDITSDKRQQERLNRTKEDFDAAAGEITADGQKKAKEAASNFKENKQDTQSGLTPERVKALERERLKQEFKEKLQEDRKQRERNRSRDKGRDYEY